MPPEERDELAAGRHKTREAWGSLVGGIGIAIVSLFCVRFPHSLRSRLPSHWLTVVGCGRGAIYGRACPSRKMVKRKERKMAEQYVEQLAAARERIVADRPELADELAKPYERGRYELL